MEEKQLMLTDGRTISWAEYGPPSGQPVLYFHGTPSSRLEPLLLNVYGQDLEQLLGKSNIRLIAIDRPGMGLSSFHQQRTFLSFADDAAQLCTYKQIVKTSIMCWSGGGTYALAMAYAHPEIIHSVYILCGFTKQFDKEVIQLMGL